jgi:hypothetical protein
VNNDIHVAEQYGFCDSVSTQYTVFNLTNHILKAWNDKEFVVGVFCDLTRAFDCVNHDLLIRKLEYYGVKGSILNWLETCLYNSRELFCKLANQLILFVSG